MSASNNADGDGNSGGGIGQRWRRFEVMDEEINNDDDEDSSHRICQKPPQPPPRSLLTVTTLTSGVSASSSTPIQQKLQQLLPSVAPVATIQSSQDATTRKYLEWELSALEASDPRSHAWYHGHGIDRDEAERLLRQCIAEEYTVTTTTTMLFGEEDNDDHGMVHVENRRKFFCFLVRESLNVRPPGRYVVSCLQVDNYDVESNNKNKNLRDDDVGNNRKLKQVLHHQRKQQRYPVLHFVINEIILQPGTVYERSQFTFGDTLPSVATMATATSNAMVNNNGEFNGQRQYQPGFDSLPDLIRYYVGGADDNAVLYYGGSNNKTKSISTVSPQPTHTEVRLRYPCNRRRSLVPHGMISHTKSKVGLTPLIQEVIRQNSHEPITTTPLFLPSQTPVSLPLVSEGPTVPPNEHLSQCLPPPLLPTPHSMHTASLQSSPRRTSATVASAMSSRPFKTLSRPVVGFPLNSSPQQGLPASSWVHSKIDFLLSVREKLLLCEQMPHEMSCSPTFTGSHTSTSPPPDLPLRTVPPPSTSGSLSNLISHQSTAISLKSEPPTRSDLASQEPSSEGNCKNPSMLLESFGTSELPKSLTTNSMRSPNISSSAIDLDPNLDTIVTEVGEYSNNDSKFGSIYSSFSRVNLDCALDNYLLIAGYIQSTERPIDTNSDNRENKQDKLHKQQQENQPLSPLSTYNYKIEHKQQNNVMMPEKKDENFSNAVKLEHDVIEQYKSQECQDVNVDGEYQTRHGLDNVSFMTCRKNRKQNCRDRIECIRLFQEDNPTVIAETERQRIEEEQKLTQRQQDLLNRQKQAGRSIQLITYADENRVERWQPDIDYLISSDSDLQSQSELEDSDNDPVRQENGTTLMNPMKNSHYLGKVSEEYQLSAGYDTTPNIEFFRGTSVSNLHDTDTSATKTNNSSTVTTFDDLPSKLPTITSSMADRERNGFGSIRWEGCDKENLHLTHDNCLHCQGSFNNPVNSTLEHHNNRNNDNDQQHNNHDSNNKHNNKHSCNNLNHSNLHYRCMTSTIYTRGTENYVEDIDYVNIVTDSEKLNHQQKRPKLICDNRGGNDVITQALRAIHLAIIGNPEDSIGASSVAGTGRLAAALCRADGRAFVLPYREYYTESRGKKTLDESITCPCPLQILGQPGPVGRRARLDVIERFACLQYLVAMTVIVTPCLLLIGHSVDTANEHLGSNLTDEYEYRRRRFYYHCAGSSGWHLSTEDGDTIDDNADFELTVDPPFDSGYSLSSRGDWTSEKRHWLDRLARHRAAALDKWIRIAADAKQAVGDVYGYRALMSALCSDRIQALRDAWSSLRQLYTATAVAFESRLRPEFLGRRDKNIVPVGKAVNDFNDDNDSEIDVLLQLPPNATVPDATALAVLYEHIYNDNNAGSSNSKIAASAIDINKKEEKNHRPSSLFTSPLLLPPSPWLSSNNGISGGIGSSAAVDFGLHTLHVLCVQYSAWIKQSPSKEDSMVSSTKSPMLQLDRFRRNFQTLLRQYDGLGDDDDDENEDFIYSYNQEDCWENEVSCCKKSNNTQDDAFAYERHYEDKVEEYSSGGGDFDDYGGDDDDDNATVIFCSNSKSFTVEPSVKATTLSTSSDASTLITLKEKEQKRTTNDHNRYHHYRETQDQKEDSYCRWIKNAGACGCNPAALNTVFRTELHVRLFWPPTLNLLDGNEHVTNHQLAIPAYALGTTYVAKVAASLKSGGKEHSQSPTLLNHIITAQLERAAQDMRLRYKAMDTFLDRACKYSTFATKSAYVDDLTVGISNNSSVC